MEEGDEREGRGGFWVWLEEEERRIPIRSRNPDHIGGGGRWGEKEEGTSTWRRVRKKKRMDKKKRRSEVLPVVPGKLVRRLLSAWGVRGRTAERQCGGREEEADRGREQWAPGHVNGSTTLASIRNGAGLGQTAQEL